MQGRGHVVADAPGIITRPTTQEGRRLLALERWKIDELDVPIAGRLCQAAPAEQQQPTAARMHPGQLFERREVQLIGVVDHEQQFLAIQRIQHGFRPGVGLLGIQSQLVGGSGGHIVHLSGIQPDGCHFVSDLVEQAVRECGFSGTRGRTQVDHLAGIAHQVQQ